MTLFLIDKQNYFDWDHKIIERKSDPLEMVVHSQQKFASVLSGPSCLKADYIELT